MKQVYTCLIFIIGLVFLGGCFDVKDPAEERADKARSAGKDDPILIGVPAPWELFKDLGFHYRDGMEMAMDEINQDKIMGRKIELLWMDDEGSVSRARAVAQELADNTDVVAVVGHAQSSICIPTSLIYQHSGVLMINAWTTANRLTARGGLDLVFRNIPNDNQMAAQIAKPLQLHGFKRAVVLNEETEYGRSLANSFENRVRQKGLSVVDRRSYDFTTSEPQFRSIIRNWKRFYNFDVIMLAGALPQAAEFIKLVRDMGVDVQIIGGDGLASPMLWELAEDNAEGVIVGTYFHPQQYGDKTRTFVENFKDRYGVEPDAAAAQAYDTLHLLARAMRVAESTVPHEVANALRNMEPFHGLLGLTEFDSRGDLTGRSAVFTVVRDGRFALLNLNSSQKE